MYRHSPLNPLPFLLGRTIPFSSHSRHPHLGWLGLMWGLMGSTSAWGLVEDWLGYWQPGVRGRLAPQDQQVLQEDPDLQALWVLWGYRDLMDLQGLQVMMAHRGVLDQLDLPGLADQPDPQVLRVRRVCLVYQGYLDQPGNPVRMAIQGGRDLMGRRVLPGQLAPQDRQAVPVLQDLRDLQAPPDLQAIQDLLEIRVSRVWMVLLVGLDRQVLRGVRVQRVPLEIRDPQVLLVLLVQLVPQVPVVRMGHLVRMARLALRVPREVMDLPVHRVLPDSNQGYTHMRLSIRVTGASESMDFSLVDLDFSKIPSATPGTPTVTETLMAIRTRLLDGTILMESKQG